MIILSDYYTSIAQKSGSPRLRETLFRCIRMVARLKLKTEADDKDAFEVCEFMNRLLRDRQAIANIPASPKDHAFQELLYKLEANVNPILFEDLVGQICFNDDYIKSYIGPNRKLRNNKKLQYLEKLILTHPQVRKTQLKPLMIQWIPKHPEGCRCDRCDQCASKNTTLSPIKSAEITSDTSLDERVHVQEKARKTQKTEDDGEKIGSQMSHRSHSQTQGDHNGFDIDRVKIVNLTRESCDILLGRQWPKGIKGYPLAGMSGYFGNPYHMGKDGTQGGSLNEIQRMALPWY